MEPVEILHYVQLFLWVYMCLLSNIILPTVLATWFDLARWNLVATHCTVITTVESNPGIRKPVQYALVTETEWMTIARFVCMWV